MTSNSIAILPETHGEVLCLRLTGIVSAADFERDFGSRITELVKRYGRFRLLVHYAADFEGWDTEAAELDLRSIALHHTHAARLAYVNPSRKKILQMELKRPIFSAEIRLFQEADLAEALAWIQADLGDGVAKRMDE